ncbi:MAG: hypothetical protein IT427_13680 [Pirellulales bacterium]|nr:hypothetical protein [Pirellulales bacterium]
MRSGINTNWIGIAIWIAQLAIVAGATGEPSDRSDPATSVVAPRQFQRIFVPADQPNQWPKDESQHYLPMSIDEFERRVRQLGESYTRSATIPAASLLDAQYAAKLTDDCLTGTATWHFEHNGKDRKIVFLENCRLAINSPAWLDSQRPAILGSDRQGRLAAIVERSGKLHCNWSLRGQRSAGGQLRFDLSLPPCAVSTLEIALPAKLIPTVDRGLVSLATSATSQGGVRTWAIQLGGYSQAHLRIAPREASRQQRPSPIIRNHFVYECSERGLELNAEFRMDAAGDAVARLTLLADEPLTVVSAHLDEVECSVKLSADDVGGHSQWTLRLPEPLSGRNRKLRIRAVAPLKYGTLQRLPLLQIAETRWQQGTVSLIILPPLLLEDLTTVDCRQIAAESLAVSSAPEALEVQLYSNAPQIKFQVASKQDRIQIAAGTSIVLRPNQAVGHFRGALTATADERFTIEAIVAPQWTIDSVAATSLQFGRETAPPAASVGKAMPAPQPVELVDDWNFTALDGRVGKLAIELKSPLTSRRGIELKISGHRRRANGRETLNVEDLRMLDFDDTISTRRLIQVQTTEKLQIQSANDERLQRLAAESLASSDAALLAGQAIGLIFVDDERARTLSISTIAQPPRFSTIIRGDVHVHEGTLSEMYHLAIRPQGQEIDRLLVRFTQPREEAVRWQLIGEPQVELLSRRLAAEEQTELGFPEGETWEVRLPVPQNKEFSLSAERDRPFRGDTPVALASVLRADTQLASVQIRYSGPNAPEIRSRRLKSIPLEPLPPNQISNILAALQYDPNEISLVSAEPPLILAPRLELSARAGAWVWQAHLESRYDNEEAEHVLTCRVENTGRDQIRFQLPAGADLKGAWIDDRATIDPLLADPQHCQVKLPPEARFITVVLRWIDAHARLGKLSQFASPWPECAVPILMRKWTVAIPPGTEVAWADLGNGSQNDRGMLPRLFGPLLRVADAPIQSVSTATVTADNGTDADHKSLALPWKVDLKDRFLESDGWKIYRFEGLSGNRATIWVANERSALAWFWATFAIAAAIRGWIGNRRPTVEIGLVTAVTAAALLVPPAWTTFSAAVWLAMVATQCFLWCRPRSGSAGSAMFASESFARRRALVAAGTATGWLIVAACHGLISAQEPTTTQAETGRPEIAHENRRKLPLQSTASVDQESPPVQVLIPADPDGHPVGGACYLPESFHRWLVMQTERHESPSPDYLLLSAVYEAAQNRAGNDAAPVSRGWKSIYEIESLVTQAIIDMPLGFNGAALEPGGVLIDGKPANLRKNESLDSVGIEVPDAGRHRLEVQFRPQYNAVGYDFAIPVTACAELHLTSRDSAAPLIVSAIGERRSVDRDHATVALGPSPRIVLQESMPVPHASQDGHEVADFEGDQVCWLNVRPGAVTVDVRYLVRVRKGRLSQLRLAIDPRLQLLPSAESGVPPRFRVAENEPGLLLIDWPEPIAGQTTVNLSLMLTDATGIGNLHFPVMDLRDGQTIRRFWGVSVDPTLEFSAHLSNEAAKVTAEEFGAAWEAASSIPQLAFSLSGNEVGASYLAVHPAVPKRSARYQLAAIVEPTAVELYFQAAVSSDAPFFQYRLRTPENFQIEEVLALDGAERHPLRWTRCRDTAVTIFLDASFSGERKLLVRGRMPLQPSGEWVLPDIRLDGSSHETFDALILRRPDALVEITDASGATTISADSQASLGHSWQESGDIPAILLEDARVVAVVNGSKQYAPVAVKIQSNSPRTRVRQLTTLERQAERWQAMIDVDVRVEAGLLDQLRFDVPANWTGPFEIVPKLPSHWEDSTHRDQKQLVVQPPSPIAKSFRLRIAGPIALASNRRWAAPQVRMRGLGSRSSYLLLPRRYEQEQLSWDTSGLVDKPLPEGLPSGDLDLKNYRSLEQVSDYYRAELRSVERGIGNAQVRLADFSIALRSDGSVVGVAGFELEPGGAANCPLELPNGAQLIDARLDRAPAQMSRLSDNRWNVWLGESSLPRQFDVLYFQLQSATFQSPAELQAPIMVDVPVRKTLWTICTRENMGTASPESGRIMDENAHGLLRAQSVADLLASAEKEALQEPESRLSGWYQEWLQRLQSGRYARERILEAKTGDTANDETTAQFAQIVASQAKLADRLGMTDTFQQATASRPTVANLGALLESIQPSSDAKTHVLLRGNESTLNLEFPHRAGDPTVKRLLAALATVLLGGVLMAVTWRTSRSVRSIRFLPEGIGVLAGLAWWIWLSPAVVGPGIIVVSIAAAWSSRRPARPAATAAGSTVARLAAEPKSSQLRVRPR